MKRKDKNFIPYYAIPILLVLVISLLVSTHISASKTSEVESAIATGGAITETSGGAITENATTEGAVTEEHRIVFDDYILIRGGKKQVYILSDTKTGEKYMLADDSLIKLTSEKDVENEEALLSEIKALNETLAKQNEALKEQNKRLESLDNKLQAVESAISSLQANE